MKVLDKQALYKELKDHPLTKRAIKSSGKTFDELIDNFSISVEDGDPEFPESWPMMFSIKISQDCWSDVRVFIILIWSYSEDSFSDQFEPHRRKAAEYLLKEEYAIGYIRDQALQEGRKVGGKQKAIQRQIECDLLSKKIITLWHELDNKDPHNRAEIIAKRLGITAKTVRHYLKKANLL